MPITVHPAALAPAGLVIAALLLSGCGADQSDTPVAIDQAIAMPAGVDSANTLDAQSLNSGTPSYVILQQPVHGTLQLDPSTGTFIYTPVSGFIGSDAFSWDVSNGDGTSGVGVVSIEVVAAAAALAPQHRSDAALACAERSCRPPLRWL